MESGLSEKYVYRCYKRLKELGAPLDGWTCAEVIDYEDEGFKCELCDYPSVRYVHVMVHHEYPDELQVGCICAGVMEGNIMAAKERDAQAKRRGQRKSNYLKKQWKAVGDDRWEVKYKRRAIAVERDCFYGREFYKIHLNDDQYHWKNNKRMDSFLAAQHYVFELIEEEACNARENNRTEVGTSG